VKVPHTLLVVGAASALTVVLTWPIAARFGSAGRLDSGDGRFSIWNVAWVAHALTTAPSQLYDANIFAPHEGTLAYSEANIFAGAIAVPVWLLTKNPIAATNWAILCGFVLAFVTMFALMRRLSGSIAAASAAAIWFAFCPFVFSHIPHIQLLMTFGLPLILLRLHAFVDAPSVRTAVWLGAAMALQGIACGYYGIAGGLLAGLGVAWFGLFEGRWRRWQYWALGVAAAAVALALILPFYAPYAELRDAGFGRSLEDARLHSVRWRSYLASPRFFDTWLLEIIDFRWREVLFPGLLPVVFTLFLAFRRLRTTAPASAGRGVVGFYALIGVFGFWLSLGPDGGLYTLLYKILPFFDMTRAPSRFGLIVTLSFAVLGGFGFAALQRLLRGRTQAIVMASLVAIIASRSSPWGLQLTEQGPQPLAYQRLALMPRATVVAFPYWTGPVNRHRHTEYMLASTSNWNPLVNGYSDYIPPDLFADKRRLEHFPAPEAWQPLRDRNVRYVLIHWNFYPPEQRHEVVRQTRHLARSLRLVVHESDVSLYEIVSWPEGTN
jgi:hypothetical protein